MDFLLIDGNNLAARANFAEPNLKKEDGTPTGVTYISIKSIRSLIEKFKPKKTIVIFDRGWSKWRLELYPEYKANRKVEKPTQEEIEEKERYINQIKRFEEYLSYLPVSVVSVKKTEADDIIANILNQAIAKNIANKFLLVSNDSDFYQFIPFGVNIYDGIKNIFIDEKHIKEKLEIDSKNYIFYKSLLGDKSDNIDAVKGFGKKAAVTLINSEPVTGLSGLKEVAKTIKGKKYKDLVEGFDKIERNFKLIDLLNPDNLSEEIQSKIKEMLSTKNVFNKNIFNLCEEDEMRWDAEFFKSFDKL